MSIIETKTNVIDMPIHYRNPRTHVLNYNTAMTFENAFAYHVAERPTQRASHRLVIIADDLAHIVNANNRVVVELIDCEHRARDVYFRNEKQIERPL